MNKSSMMRDMQNFLADDSGTTAIEYAILAAGIAGVLVAVVMSIGTSLNTMYTSVSNGFK
jgi:pilus assembly protein Flp/PilA